METGSMMMMILRPTPWVTACNIHQSIRWSLSNEPAVVQLKPTNYFDFVIEGMRMLPVYFQGARVVPREYLKYDWLIMNLKMYISWVKCRVRA